MGAHLVRGKKKVFCSAGMAYANALWLRGKSVILGGFPGAQWHACHPFSVTPGACSWVAESLDCQPT